MDDGKAGENDTNVSFISTRRGERHRIRPRFFPPLDAKDDHAPSVGKPAFDRSVLDISQDMGSSMGSDEREGKAGVCGEDKRRSLATFQTIWGVLASPLRQRGREQFVRDHGDSEAQIFEPLHCNPEEGKNRENC